MLSRFVFRREALMINRLWPIQRHLVSPGAAKPPRIDSAMVAIDVEVRERLDDEAAFAVAFDQLKLHLPDETFSYGPRKRRSA